MARFQSNASINSNSSPLIKSDLVLACINGQGYYCYNRLSSAHKHRLTSLNEETETLQTDTYRAKKKARYSYDIETEVSPDNVKQGSSVPEQEKHSSLWEVITACSRDDISIDNSGFSMTIPVSKNSNTATPFPIHIPEHSFYDHINPLDSSLSNLHRDLFHDENAEGHDNPEVDYDGSRILKSSMQPHSSQAAMHLHSNQDDVIIILESVMDLPIIPAAEISNKLHSDSVCPICLECMSLDPSLLCSSSRRSATTFVLLIATALSTPNFTSLGDKENSSTAMAPCGHRFHGGCITMAMTHAFRKSDRPVCPLCRAPFTHRGMKSQSTSSGPGWPVLVDAARRAARHRGGSWAKLRGALGCTGLLSILIGLVVHFTR